MPTASIDNDSLNVGLLLSTLVAFRKGDFSARMPLDWTGTAGKVADTLNSIIETNDRMSQELARLSRTVGKAGRLEQRLSLGDVTGTWAGKVDSINTLLEDLARPAAETARVPQAAIAASPIDHVLPLAEIPPLLARLCPGLTR